MTIIEVCHSNKANGKQSVYEQLAHDPEWADVEILEYDCLGQCALCSVQSFVILEGEIVAADRPELLLEEIKKQLKEKEELDRQWRELGF